MRYVLFTILLFLLLDTDRCMAQYDLDSLVMPEEIHTVGVNVTPFGIMVLGGDSERRRFGVTYKKQVDVSKKIRVRGQFERLRYADNELTEIPYSWTDSTITFEYYSYLDMQYDVRVGIEFFKPNRTTTMVYGADVIAGYATDYDEGYLRSFKVDTTFCDYCFRPHEIEGLTEWEKQIDYGVVGLDFSVGQMLRINEIINITLLWCPELIYRIPMKEYYSVPSQREDAPESQLRMRLRGIELWLCAEF